MRKILNPVLLISAALLFICSCNNEKLIPEQPQEGDLFEYQFALGSENDGTKAVLTDATVSWQSGDYLGVLTKSTEGSISYANDITKSAITPASGDTPAKFMVKSYSALATGGKVFCFFPYENGSYFTTTNVTLSFPTSQNNTINEMPMASIPFTVTSDVPAQIGTDVGEIKMIMLGSVARFNIYTSDDDFAGETIQSIQFIADKAIAGSGSIDLEKIDYNNESTLAIKSYSATSITETVNQTVSLGKTNAVEVNMVVAPGEYSGTIVVKTDKAEYSYAISEAKTFGRAHIKPFSVDLVKGERREASVVATLGEWTTKPISGSNSLNVYGTLKDDKNNSWSVALTGSDASKNPSQSVYTGTTYWQIGANGNMSTAVFTTNVVSGTITSIDVDCAAYKGCGSVSVTVDSKDFGTQNQSIPTWTNNKGGTVQFNSSASGDIVVTLAATEGGRAIYLSSIKVTYVPGGGSSTPAPTFSVAEGQYNTAQTVKVANYDNNYLYYYTIDGTTPGCDSDLNPTGTSVAYDNNTGISISSSCTLKMFAVDLDGNKSSVTSAEYSISSETKVTWTVKDDANNPGNGVAWYSGSIDGNISWSATKGGSNAPAYYDTGTGLRIYNGGTFTVTAANNKKITKVVLTFSGTSYTFSTSNTNQEQTYNLNSVTSYVWNVSRTCRLQKVEVTYE